MAGGRLYLHPIGTWADASITQVAGWLSVTGIVHQGMDYGVVHGTPVRAAAPGMVRRAIDGIPDNWTGDWRRGSSAWGGYGNHVLIDHPDGGYTLYAHLAPGSVAVEAGQQVAAGQHLGLVGTSGYATGPHLHFELKHPPSYAPYDFRAELTDDLGAVERAPEGGPEPAPPPAGGIAQEEDEEMQLVIQEPGTQNQYLWVPPYLHYLSTPVAADLVRFFGRQGKVVENLTPEQWAAIVQMDQDARAAGGGGSVPPHSHSGQVTVT